MGKRVEVKIERTLVLFQSNKGEEMQLLPSMVAEGKEDNVRGRSSVEEEEPIPLNSFHPSVSH